MLTIRSAIGVVLPLLLLAGLAVAFLLVRCAAPVPVERVAPPASPDAQGLTVRRYGTGELKSIGPTVDGEPHGDWTAWWKNGNVAWHGTFVRGKRHGVFTYYDTDGRRPELYRFENGVKVSGPE